MSLQRQGRGASAVAALGLAKASAAAVGDAELTARVEAARVDIESAQLRADH